MTGDTISLMRRFPSKTGPLGEEDEASHLFRILARANRIASTTELDELLNQMLDLIIKVCGANAGTLYLLDEEAQELIFQVVKGDEESQKLVGTRMSAEKGIVGATVRKGKPIVVSDLGSDPRWYSAYGKFSGTPLRNAIAFPLLLRGEAIGVVQIFNYIYSPLQLMQLLGNRMASEIEKAILLQASEQRGQRLEALIAIIGQIGSTLDRDQVMRLIVDYARELLNAEASAIYLLDEETDKLTLHLVSHIGDEKMTSKFFPVGRSVIGKVIETGETALENDPMPGLVYSDESDQFASKITSSIIAVPLRARSVILGHERGIAEEQIIGGLAAINKLEARFTNDDAQLLRTLASQAGTISQIAHLYNDANELFFNVIEALAAAIDAKDPYTVGHSRRVSEFSVAIARRLSLNPETIRRVRIGSLLHDVGKIGITDAILTKPGRLTIDEYQVMREHPTIGARIMSPVRMLHDSSPALSEHHERLDGSGYPQGLMGEEISLLGRIVAVADIFDAMTSDRPYREALSSEKTLDYLHEGSGSAFDVDCVGAITQAYLKGDIRTQKEREMLDAGDLSEGEDG